MFITGFFEDNAKLALPLLLTENPNYFNEAIQLAKYICCSKDKEIIALMESMIVDSRKSTEISLLVYSDNSKEIQEKFIASHSDLEIDQINYINRGRENVACISGTRDLGQVIFTPTGLVDKSYLNDALEIIKNANNAIK